MIDGYLRRHLGDWYGNSTFRGAVIVFTSKEALIGVVLGLALYRFFSAHGVLP